MIGIEKVMEEDAKELLDIYTPYVEDTAISFEYEVPSEEEFRKRIRSISVNYPYLKAVDETGRILGYAYASAFKARMAYDWSVETTIYIRKDVRRSGVGKVLYTELEEQLKKMGILNANACIAVTDKEDPYLTNDSVYFHEALGYHLVGTFHASGYKFDTWYDMVWMEKMLGEHKSPAEPVILKERELH